MNTLVAEIAAPPGVDLDFIRELAQHRAIAPALVFRRLKIIGTILGMSLLGEIATILLLGLGVSLSAPARMLTAVGLVASVVVMLGALASAGLLLWGGFISQYVAALDARAQVVEAFQQADEESAPAEADAQSLHDPAIG